MPATAAIHTNNEALVREYGLRMHACRIIWNQPSSLGGIGDIYNAIAPSLTLGCGSYGGNSVSGNVQAVNLINIKRIARRNNNMQWFKIPAKTYFEPNAIKYLRDMHGIEKAVIVCDKVMEQLGIVDKVIDQLRARDNRVTFRIIDYVEPEPSVETVERGAEMMREEFEPDTIIAVGGGSPMDAAKIMWLLYEHPEISFSDVREKFFDIRKRAFRIPPLGEKAKLVCIPTSSGTGSEVTPFAVITDHKTGYKYPITDYALTPSVAIVDPVLASHPAAQAGLRRWLRRPDPLHGSLRVRVRERLHRRHSCTRPSSSGTTWPSPSTASRGSPRPTRRRRCTTPPPWPAWRSAPRSSACATA